MGGDMHAEVPLGSLETQSTKADTQKVSWKLSKTQK